MATGFVTVIYVLAQDTLWRVRMVATGQTWDFLSRTDAEVYAKELAQHARPSEVVIKRPDGSVDYILHYWSSALRRADQIRRCRFGLRNCAGERSMSRVRVLSHAERPFSWGSIASFAGHSPMTGASVRIRRAWLLLLDDAPQAVEAEENVLQRPQKLS